MSSNEIIMIALASCTVVLAIGLIVSFIKLRTMKLQLHALAAISGQNQESIRALFSGAAGVGDHLTRIEQLMRRVSERQDQLDLKDVSNHSYDHAIRLIQSGADYDEIISRCGLVKEEADLLVQMYRYDKAS